MNWCYGYIYEGVDQRIQVPAPSVIGSYIIDFVCLEAKLIIEADGGQHAEQVVYDAKRTARLEAIGYRVMRLWNHEILGELTNVLEQIQTALIEAPSS